MTAPSPIFKESRSMRIRRFKSRIGSLLLALAFVGSGLLMAFHSHDAEAKGAEHCATCHLGHQAKIGSLESAQPSVASPQFTHESLLPLNSPKLIAPAFLLGKVSQAPPRA